MLPTGFKFIEKYGKFEIGEKAGYYVGFSETEGNTQPKQILHQCRKECDIIYTSNHVDKKS